MYVSMKSFLVLFSVQLERTWASKDAQADFVTVSRTQSVTKHVCRVQVQANI